MVLEEVHCPYCGSNLLEATTILTQGTTSMIYVLSQLKLEAVIFNDESHQFCPAPAQLFRWLSDKQL